MKRGGIFCRFFCIAEIFVVLLHYQWDSRPKVLDEQKKFDFSPKKLLKNLVVSKFCTTFAEHLRKKFNPFILLSMSHFVSNTYAVRVRVYSEPNKGGNMSEYWLKGKIGKEFKFAGRNCRKVYTNRSWADKACYAIMNNYENVSVSVVTI